MDRSIIINKILQYIDYHDFLNTIKVSKLWRTLSINFIFSIPCHICLKSNRRVFSNIFLSPTSIPIYCLNCRSSNSFSLPIIPIMPGDTTYFWKTSDIPKIWKSLWFYTIIDL